MAEVAVAETVDPNTTDAAATAAATAAAVDMDVEKADGSEPKQKRDREADEAKDEREKDDVVSKKQKVEDEKSVEEQRMEKLEEPQEEEEKKESCENVKLGPKSFGSSLDMFNYFYNFLNTWPHYININKYEHLVLLELLKKGHADPNKKIGIGIRAFQVRKHPTFKSRCFFIIRDDDSVDDFSFRKCVDHILPLPEEVHLKSEQNKSFGSGGDGGRHYGGGGRHFGGKGGRGRGGKGRGGRRH